MQKLSAKQKLIILTAVGIAALGIFLGGSIFNLVHNKLELRRLTKKSAQLDVEYEKLLTEKKLLQDQDPKYMETLARTRYNMVKPGEIEFRFKHD
ncbi:MAG: septum formation initiator family protein [Elusimicrobiaceae bacterium]|nr:septum formation initiator family protein [Elusimicrobiaceae bacterium]